MMVGTKSGADKTFTVVNTTIVTLFFIAVAYPLVYVVSCSLSDALAVVQGKVWLWPVGFTLEGYKAVLAEEKILTGYFNSGYYMVLGTSINIIMTVIAAYPLSRKDFVDRNLIMGLFVFTMLFNGGLIPTYLLIKSLGLVNTRAVMILPKAIGVYNIIIARTYFQSTIPDELLEAAKMDGCSDFRFISKVVIPLSGPILAVITLFYAVGHWNTFFDALIYLKNPKLFPLQIILRDILVENQMTDMSGGMEMEDLLEKQRLMELLKYSLIIVASLPLLILYPFIQKYFVKGVMIGSIKG